MATPHMRGAAVVGHSPPSGHVENDREPVLCLRLTTAGVTSPGDRSSSAELIMRHGMTTESGLCTGHRLTASEGGAWSGLITVAPLSAGDW